MAAVVAASAASTLGVVCVGPAPVAREPICRASSANAAACPSARLGYSRSLSGSGAQALRAERRAPAACARVMAMAKEEEDDDEEAADARPKRDRRFGGDDGARKKPEADDGIAEEIVQISRVTKVVKGGKQMAFRAVVVVGDKNGSVGIGVAKSKEVITAVTKAATAGRKGMLKVPLNKHKTFPHRVTGIAGSASVMLRPAAEGTGVIAGGAVRAVLDLAGVENAFGKQLGSGNPLNNARAVINGFEQMQTFDEVAKKRGMTLQELWS
eukprot:jgi/Chlat1/1385/Chrsp12S01967